VASEPKFPPSLNRLLGMATADESEKNARRRKVEKALRAIPLADDAKKQVSQLSPLFEMTYDGVNARKHDRRANAALVERQLSDMVRRCNKLAAYLTGMHPDAVRLWGKTAGVSDDVELATSFGELLLTIQTAGQWAEQALAVAKATHRVAAKRGNPGDATAAALRDPTAFVYTKLTGKRSGRAYDVYKQEERDTEFIKLLRCIYKAFGIKAGVHYRVRQLPRRMDDNSKK
jgi:hypothetical protein